MGEGEGARFDTTVELDKWMADYLEDACYGREKGFDFGAQTFFGFLALFPEYKMKLSLSYRAYHTWKVLHVGGEGSTIPEEAVYIIINFFEQHGLKEQAIITETSLDVYFRTHEWCQIRGEDIFDDGELVGLALGVAERNERVKTGRHQGVVLDSPYLRERWAEIKRLRKPHELALSISPDKFKDGWERAKAAAGLSWIGPEHGLRHAGAARDVEQGTRTLEQVRRRGRWRALDSVQRYTKTWLLIKARSQMTTKQLEHGRKVLSSRPPRLIAG